MREEKNVVWDMLEHLSKNYEDIILEFAIWKLVIKQMSEYPTDTALRRYECNKICEKEIDKWIK